MVVFSICFCFTDFVYSYVDNRKIKSLLHLKYVCLNYQNLKWKHILYKNCLHVFIYPGQNTHLHDFFFFFYIKQTIKYTPRITKMFGGFKICLTSLLNLIYPYWRTFWDCIYTWPKILFYVTCFCVICLQSMIK